MKRWTAWSVRLGVAVAAVLPSATIAQSVVPICPISAGPARTGRLPHRSSTLYTDAHNHWNPVATDGHNVLMGWQTSREPKVGGPVHLSVVHLPSTRLVPLPRSAYPRRTFLDGWHIEWPWIVGIAFTTPLPAIPANWQLWVGNAVTGKHFIIDSYRAHRHPVPGFFPNFALDHGRVVWEFSAARPVRFDTFSAQRLALIDLGTRKQRFLTLPDTDAVLDRLTMSGSRVVWDRAPINASSVTEPPVDLWMVNTRTDAITRLSDNASVKQSSLYPRLEGNHLLFEQGPFGSDFGHPYLVDLSARIASGHRQWWRNYRFRSLGATGLTNTQMGDGLVSWDNNQIQDLTRNQDWTWPPTSTDRWIVLFVAGRTAVVERLDPNDAHMTYQAWQIPAACTVRGFDQAAGGGRRVMLFAPRATKSRGITSAPAATSAQPPPARAGTGGAWADRARVEG